MLGLVAVALIGVAMLVNQHRFAMGVVAIAVITLAGVTAGYVVVAQALRPLQQVTVTAQKLSGETLDQRIRYTGVDDEVAELASTFDAMLDRLAESFEAQKRFVANASHELRTPLAVMRTEIDVTMSDPEVDLAEYRRMAVVVRDASERMNSLIESLLVLARSEAQAGRRLVRKVPADLCRGVPAALSAVEREAGRLGLAIETDLAARAGGRRPEPAGPARRQPDRERGALQPRSRAPVGTHVPTRRTPAWSSATPASRSTRPTYPGCSKRSSAACATGPAPGARGWACPSCGRSAKRTAVPSARSRCPAAASKSP